MEGGNLNAAPAVISGVAFRRRQMGVNQAGRRQAYTLFGSVAAFFAAVFLFLQYQISQLPHHPVAHHPVHHNSSFDLYMMLLVALLGAVGLWLSSKYERIYVSPKGIRYVTLFGGPFAFLASTFPSWELAWDDLAGIRLLQRTGARASRGAQMWYYEFQPRQGAARRLGAASWRLDGKPDELDLTLFQNLKRDPAIFKTAFAKTGLFKLLDLTLRARKSQFPNPLIGGQ